MRLANQIASDISFNLLILLPRNISGIRSSKRSEIIFALINVGNDQIAAKRGDLSRLHIERNGVPLRIEPRLGGRIGDLVDGCEAALRRKTKSPGSRRVRTAPGLSGSMEQERHLSFVTDRITQRI
jgi:hypothetical protein